MPIQNIAIVGAGLSGVAAASLLGKSGFEIRIFEKSRGCGGRMATRRSSGYEFDHGAQYFTVRDEAFKRIVEAWIAEGAVKPWDGRIATVGGGQTSFQSEEPMRYVGTPRMSSLVRHFAGGIDIEFETRIVRLERVGRRWQLASHHVMLPGIFDAVILAIPPAQAGSILKETHSLFPQLFEIPMLPCWAVMAAFEQPLRLSFDGAFIHDSSLSWISRNSSKPLRQDKECWVLHSSPEWSLEHFEAEPEWVCSTLLAEFFAETKHSVLEATWIKAHRWRYALAASPLSNGCLWDPETRVGVCGDWCHGSRIEGAFLSGIAMVDKLVKTMAANRR